ncbi:hypothetical protein AAFC00_005698 [Neodothiora populina]
MSNWQTDEDLAEFQELSNKYEPEATGPLVGERQSSAALATEYAAADPIYRTKTAKLPESYSHYRTCRGDGRCGWRAIAFAYFESLLRMGSKSKFLEEETRLKSLTNLMNIAGFDKWSYEDFADETYGLLRKYMGTVDDPDVEASLVADFNDEELQNYIITHFKVLAAAWMKTRPDEYAPFILPQTVDGYVEAAIMPHGTEIDHPGINAITDILLKPAGIALDVIYLDLSHGDEATTHQFAAGTDASATINLLYRPGHYDILYKRETSAQPQPPPQGVAAPTYLQYGTYDEEPIMDVGVPDFLAMMPGMSMVPNQTNWMANPFYPSTESTYSAPPPLPVQHHAPPPTASVAPAYSVPPSVATATPATPSPSQDFYGSNVSPTETATHHGLLFAHSNMARGTNFRPSQYMSSQSALASSGRNIDFQTSQFRNSHFNTAHFLNPDFHPDEWSPENDYITPNNRSKHKPSG